MRSENGVGAIILEFSFEGAVEDGGEQGVQFSHDTALLGQRKQRFQPKVFLGVETLEPLMVRIPVALAAFWETPFS
jgi:RNase P/RNase MRP subunit p30